METQLIKSFIKNVGVKNYSEANKYLQKVLENKIKSRIKTALNKPLF